MNNVSLQTSVSSLSILALNKFDTLITNCTFVLFERQKNTLSGFEQKDASWEKLRLGTCLSGVSEKYKNIFSKLFNNDFNDFIDSYTGEFIKMHPEIPLAMFQKKIEWIDSYTNEFIKMHPEIPLGIIEKKVDLTNQVARNKCYAPEYIKKFFEICFEIPIEVFEKKLNLLNELFPTFDRMFFFEISSGMPLNVIEGIKEIVLKMNWHHSDQRYEDCYRKKNIIKKFFDFFRETKTEDITGVIKLCKIIFEKLSIANTKEIEKCLKMIDSIPKEELESVERQIYQIFPSSYGVSYQDTIKSLTVLLNSDKENREILINKINNASFDDIDSVSQDSDYEDMYDEQEFIDISISKKTARILCYDYDSDSSDSD